MKRILNKLRRDEKGQALILALILLLVGGLIIAPLLGFMSTGLKAGQVHEQLMERLYAADAGVEDAIYNIITPTAPYYEELQGLDDGGSLDPYQLTDINGKTVSVTIYCQNKSDAGATYKITSVATSADGSSTTIESWVQILPFFWTKAAISCGGPGPPSSIVTKPGVVVNGPTLDDYDPAKWPFGLTLSNIYHDQINEATDSWPSGTLDVKDYPTFGPLFREGNLSQTGVEKGIYNTGDADAMANIGSIIPEHEHETVYVTGNLDIGVTSQDFTLNLNYNTIYCEGNIFVGGKTTITGSGCIIAKGDVDFKPKMSSSPSDFVFVMSENGTVRFEPTGDFYGSLAGNIEIELWPGNTLTLSTPPIEYLNFPLGDVESAVKILTWEVSLQ